MVLLGLLLLALVCLALGLVLTSAAWLIASLIASAGAGFLLWRTGAAAAARGNTRPRRASTAASAGTATRAGSAATMPPAQAATATTVRPAPADPIPAAGVSALDDPQVWVIDGRPRYHLVDCAIIKGQDAEPIPYSQATEDGFMPCSLCEPNAARTAS